MAAMFALLEDRSADLSTLLDQAMAHLQTGLQSA
jgi:hypothetical protein